MKKKYVIGGLLLGLMTTLSSTQLLASTASDIYGSWGFATETEGMVITFFDDGTYYHAEDSAIGNGGLPGVELGTYTWNHETGLLSGATIFDTNGAWGLSNSTHTVNFDGGSMNVDDQGETSSFQRIADPVNPIVGTWTYESGALSCFSNGLYMIAENGIERGAYTWDPASGAFEVTEIFNDTNGEDGLSDAYLFAPITMQVNGDILTYTDIEETSVLTRAPMANPNNPTPTPVPGAVWMLGSGLAGLIAVRRRKN